MQGTTDDDYCFVASCLTFPFPPFHQCPRTEACTRPQNGTGKCFGVLSSDTCSLRNQYRVVGLCGTVCDCCRTCVPDNTCGSRNGLCYSLASGGCPVDRIPALTGQGTCNDSNCLCCIPRVSHVCVISISFSLTMILVMKAKSK